MRQSRDVNRIADLGDHFCKDLEQIAAKFPDSVKVCQFLQFFACSEIARYFQTRKVSSIAQVWLQKSLDTNMSSIQPQSDDPVKRLMDCTGSIHPFVQNNALVAIGVWGSTLFYYGWMTDIHHPFIIALKEQFAEAFARAFTHLAVDKTTFNNTPFIYEHLQYIGHMLTWAVNAEDEMLKDVCKECLVTLFRLDDLDRNWKKDITIYLSSSDEPAGGLTGQEWAKVTFNRIR